MIRHYRSLLISLFFHSMILLGLFITFKIYSSSKEPAISANIIAINLQHKKQETSTKKVTKKKKYHQQKQKKVITKKAFLKKEVKKVKERLEKLKSLQIKKTKQKIIKKVEQKKINNQQKVRPKKISKGKIYINTNLNRLIKLIQENLYYPRQARKRSIEGKVVIRFTLSQNGTVSSIKILSSSHDILGRAAKQTIKKIASQMPKPKETLTLSVPIFYSLFTNIK